MPSRKSQKTEDAGNGKDNGNESQSGGEQGAEVTAFGHQATPIDTGSPEADRDLTVEYVREVGEAGGGGELFYVASNGKKIAQAIWRNEEMVVVGGVLSNDQRADAISAIDSFLAARTTKRPAYEGGATNR